MAGVTLRRSVMPQPMSPLRSEVEGREMAHQVMVEPSEGAELLLRAKSEASWTRLSSVMVRCSRS